MKGSPAKMGRIQGTAGHASALKMKAEANAASALKQAEERETSWWKGEEGIIPDELQPGVNRPKVKTEHGKKVEAEKKATKKANNENWKKGQAKAKSSGRDLDNLVKSRKGLKKGSDEYNAVQNQINDALSNKKRHGTTSSTKTNKRGNKTTTETNVPGISSEKTKTKVKKNVLTGGGKVVSKTTSSSDAGNVKTKQVVKANKKGEVTKTKVKTKSDYDKDGKVDEKNVNKTNVKKGTTKNVNRKDGRRTVTKTDKEGNVTTKSRRTLGGFLTGKGKGKRTKTVTKANSPADMNDKY